MQEQELVAALKRHLAELIEPNTRFDRSSLPVIQEKTETVAVRGVQQYSVSFSAEQKSGKGPLAATTIHLADDAQLQQHLAGKRTQSEQQLPARLQRWLAEQTTLPGDPLTTSDCYGGHGTAGYEHACSGCKGAGKNRCTDCGGSGDKVCSRCNGSGEVDCSSCGGKGETSCTACGGRGQVGQHRERRRVNTADNREWTESYVEYVTCWSCNGRGTKQCSCHSGHVRCGCLSGRMQCTSCGGSGQTACKACDATGILNETGALTCAVSHTFSLQAAAATPEAKHTIESLADLRALCKLARVGVLDSRVDGQSVSREIGASLALTTVRVRAIEQELELLGYGDDAAIFDFKNVVGILLQKDLTDLQQAFAGGSSLPMKRDARLDEALALFLRSEVHSAIGKFGGGKPEVVRAFAQRELRGSVSADYVTQAAKAVRSAIARTYWSEITLLALLLGLVVGATLEVLTLPAIHVFARAEAVVAAAVVLIVGGVLAELRARVRLKKRFAAEVATKAVELLHATRTFWWSRAAMIAVAVVATYALRLVVQAF